MIQSSSVLDMRGVTRSFPGPSGPVDVIKGIDLTIEPGDFVMITGPSGSGKSTFLNLAGLMDKPTSGEVLFNGQKVSGFDEQQLCTIRKKHIGFVFQKFCLLSFRSAFENVLFRFRYMHLEREEEREHALRALEDVGLSSIQDRSVRVLSAGEQQRVAIARAVALKPDLLLADEPTGNLDQASADSVMACFRKLNEQGITIVMVTHNERLLTYASRHMRCLGGMLN